MPSAKTVWGIDVGQCALKALKLQWRDGKLRALAFDVIEHAKILSQPDADEQALIRSALSKFLSRNSIKGSTLVISVPGQASFTRFIKLPPVEQRKVPEIVRYEARQQIPFNLEDVVWDWQAVSPASAGPREVEVGIFAMKRDIIADYVSDFLAMKIEPDIVQMAPVALYNYLRFDRKDAGGATVLIDCGAENTNLVIADGDRVWIRNVPLGGNNFTQALVKEFKLPFSKAENLKRHAAESKHARQVFQAMRPVFGDLLTEIQRSIGYYTSLHRDSRVERVVAIGGTFRLAGLSKFISQNLGVDVQRLESFDSMGDAEALQAPLFREHVGSFGVTFGLALQGLGQAQIGTSLLPPEILNSKVMKRKRPFFVAAGACLLGAVGAFAYNEIATSGELSGVGNEVQSLSGKVGQLRNKNAEQQAAFDKQKEALVSEQARIDRLEDILKSDTFSYQVMRTIWQAWPLDKGWAAWDATTNQPERSSLNIIELIDISMHYVPDVRVYSDTAAGPAGVGSVQVVGEVPAPPSEPGQPTAGSPSASGPVPGVLVQLRGITPKRGREGHEFVTQNLLDGPKGLKNCRRTVRLQTPAGEEILAKLPLTGLYRNQPGFSEYERSRRGEKGAEKSGVDKGGDFWFEAQWVIHVSDLKEFQRQEVFQEIAKLAQTAGLDDVRKINAARAAGPDEAKLKTIEGPLAELGQSWLVSREALSAIAAEGVTKQWVVLPPSTPTAETQPAQP
jgi:type IV pilus assembly protein PilM